jgi:arylsulfatase A-like enzyme
MSGIDRGRRDTLRLMGYGAATLALQGYFRTPFARRSGPGKPNVLFIPVDDLRPQLGCYGHSQMFSPSIDALAGRGVLFNRCYCQAPLCGPSRASLLTGARPTRTRFVEFDMRVDQDYPTATVLPQHFKANGYYTVGVGKTFHYKADSSYCWSEPVFVNNYWIPPAETDAFAAPDVPDNHESCRDGLLADYAVQKLGELKSIAQPWFLSAGFIKPHLPFVVPKKYWDMYDRNTLDLADNPLFPSSAPDAAMCGSTEIRGYRNIPDGTEPFSEALAREIMHGYYAATTFVDTQIGRVLAELVSLGLGDNTIVVLWGDHGWNLGEHAIWGKHNNFETALRSPMIVCAPGITGGTVANGLTEFVDIYPTLCDLCSLTPPDQFEGAHSFVPHMQNPGNTWKEAIFSRWENGLNMRTDRYHYTEWSDDGGQMYARMLYDHETDPDENVNIAELPENEDLVAALSQKLQAGWQGLSEPTGVRFENRRTPGAGPASGRDRHPSGPFDMKGRRVDQGRRNARSILVDTKQRKLVL